MAENTGKERVRNRTEYYQRLLRNEQLRWDTLVYPQNLGDVKQGLGSYVLFNINVTNGSRFNKQYGDGSIDNTIETADGSILRTNGERRSRSTVAALEGGTTRTDTSIMLYMPPELSVSETVQWEGSELGAAGRALNRASATSDAIKSVEGLTDLMSLGSPLGDALAQGGKDLLKTAAGGLDSVGAGDVKGAIEAFNREIKNPNVEVLFKGIDNRQFQFQFKFAPKNQKETEAIAKIIQTFRFHKAPEIKGDAEIGRHFKYPSEFNIYFYFIQEQENSDGDFVSVENPFLPKLTTCALTSLETNFNGSSQQWATHKDGMPAEIDLTISFTELDLITKDKVLQGY